MKKYIKERWLTALRSGKYPQGKGWLNQDGKFCCLGVLAEIAVEDGVVQPDPDRGVVRYRSRDGIIAHSFLSPALMEWSGIADDEGEFLNEQDNYEQLTTLNDRGMSFNDIADVIEKRF